MVTSKSKLVENQSAHNNTSVEKHKVHNNSTLVANNVTQENSNLVEGNLLHSQQAITSSATGEFILSMPYFSLSECRMMNTRSMARSKLTPPPKSTCTSKAEKKDGSKNPEKKTFL